MANEAHILPADTGSDILKSGLGGLDGGAGVSNRCGKMHLKGHMEMANLAILGMHSPAYTGFALLVKSDWSHGQNQGQGLR